MKRIFLLFLLVVYCSATTFEAADEAEIVAVEQTPTLKQALIHAAYIWKQYGLHVKIQFFSGDNQPQSKLSFYIKIYRSLQIHSVFKYLGMLVLNVQNVPIIDFKVYDDIINVWHLFWMRSIKLLDELRKLNEPADNQDDLFARNQDMIISEAIGVREEFRTLIIQSYPEYDVVDKVWSQASAAAMQSYKKELTEKVASLRTLERDTVLFPETYTELASTTIAAIDQMEKFNEILAADHSPQLIATGLIIEHITLDEMINRTVVACRLLSSDLTDDELADYNEQLSGIDRKAINDKITTALTSITSAISSIDEIYNEMKGTGEEIQREMDELKKSPKFRGIPFEFENILDALVPILPKHTTAAKMEPEYFLGEKIPTMTDYEFVDIVETMATNDELFSKEDVVMHSIPADIAFTVWLAPWQFAKSKYTKIQDELLEDAKGTKQLTWLAPTLNKEINDLLMGDLLINLLVANLKFKKPSVPKEIYDFIMQEAGKSPVDIEHHIFDLERNIKESKSDEPLEDKRNVISATFVAIKTKMQAQVVALCKRVQKAAESHSIVGLLDSFKTTSQRVIDQTRALEGRIKAAKKKKNRVAVEFLSTLLEATKTNGAFLADFMRYHDFIVHTPERKQEPIFYEYLSIISKDSLMIYTAIEVTFNSWRLRTLNNKKILKFDDQLKEIMKVCDKVSINLKANQSNMRNAFMDMTSTDRYDPKNQYIIGITNWHTSFSEFYEVVSKLNDRTIGVVENQMNKTFIDGKK